MKLLSKRLISGKVNKKIVRARESRFGKIVSVDASARRAIVRIQGTQTDIYMGWSKNFYDVPQFVRPNNPVEIQHIRGNPHAYEIIADGPQLPTPVDGTPLLTDLIAPEDRVITGSEVTAMQAGAGLQVEIGFGEVRINGDLYSIDGVYLGDSAVPLMGETFPLMGQIGGIVTLDPAPSAPNYRIDLISVGMDGVVDYTKGTEAANNPPQPALALDHVALAYIIVPYDTTVMQQSFIGNAWTDPYISVFEVSIEEMLSYWHTLPDPNTLNQPLTEAQRRVTGTIKILNQYGKPMVGSFPVTVEVEQGNGLIYKGSTGATSQTFTITDGTNNTFIYERLGVDGWRVLGDPIDQSPSIKATLLTNTNFFGFFWVPLYDSQTPNAEILI